jgi:hypothetical protein
MQSGTSEQRRCNRSPWRRALEATGTTAEVLSTLRDYLATLTPAELARLPEWCRPGRIKAEDDVEYWTFRLAQLVTSPLDEHTDAALAQQMLNVFLHALVQILRINKGEPTPTWSPSRALPFEALRPGTRSAAISHPGRY